MELQNLFSGPVNLFKIPKSVYNPKFVNAIVFVLIIAMIDNKVF